MRTHAIGSRLRSTNPHVDSNGLLVLIGYGLKLAVERGHLQFEDGIGADRRSGRLSRATSGLKRVVILGHSGYVTIEAMRWLHDIGAAVVHIDADGTVIGVNSARGLDDARLRRAQALTVFNGFGLELTKELVRDKLVAQAGIVGEWFSAPDVEARIVALSKGVDSGKDSNEVRRVESAGASLYWDAWSNEPMRFARREMPRVADHWLTFGARGSAVSGKPRNASNPANALLNYGYAILEAEATIALATIGLDPGLGIFHTDLRARDSLACDIMEPTRPFVDSLVLELLRTRTFSARDFLETREGVCRLNSTVSRALFDFAPSIRREVAPVAERLAARLLKSAPTGERWDRELPTLLTSSKRRTGRAPLPRSARTKLPQCCRECGEPIDKPRLLCVACEPELRARQFSVAGPAALRRMRNDGKDPAHGGTARERRAETISEQNRARRDWVDDGGDYSEERFRRKILPVIRELPLNELRYRTGLSLRYVSLIRRGAKIPHARHWHLLTTTSPSRSDLIRQARIVEEVEPISQ